MASKPVVEKLGDELLTCTVCYDFYSDPKVLPCLHSFCQDCLGRHYEIHKLRNSDKLCCPTCRELFPLPVNGVGGFRNDSVVGRCRELLQSLPIQLETEKDADDEANGPLMAAGFDQRAQERQKESLYVVVTHMQNALARLRSKLLHLYAAENFIKRTASAESDRNIAEKNAMELESSGETRLENGAVSHPSFAPSIAQLASEQDKLYQIIVDIKAVHDVAEEILSSASPDQFDGAFEPIMSHIQCLRSVVERESSCDSPTGSPEKFMKGLNIPASVLKDAMFSVSSKENIKASYGSDKKINSKSGLKVKLLSRVTGRGVGPSQFDFPTCASFVHNGDIVVCDKNNLRLQLFDSNLKLKDILHSGQIKPRKACFCRYDGFLYVSDELSQCVKVFGPNGHLMRHVGDGRLECAEGIAFNSKGHLIVTDPEKSYVYSMKRNGNLISKFFFRFLGDKSTPNPYFVTINEDDQIIIADHRNNKVRVFTSTGQCLFTIDNLVVPRGVCVDPSGNILVAESDKHRVSMYSPYGKFIQYLIEPEQFGLKYPLSLDVNDKGQLLVTQCDYYGQHEVFLFQIY